MLPSFYKTSLAIALNAGSADTEVFVNHATTITGETIDWANFSPFTRGTIVVNPRAVRGEDQLPEIISFTGFNSTLKKFTGCSRGRSAITDSQDTDLIVYHPANAEVIITWSGYNIQDILNYVDGLIDAATVGTSTNVIATAGETIVSGNLVYLNTDGKWWNTDADTEATVSGVQLGIARGAGTANNAITNGVTLKGRVTGLSGLVAGTTYYASNTAGGISSSVGTYSRIIGVAFDATTLFFDPNYGFSQAALVGGSSFGTPSSTNKYVTQDFIEPTFGDGSDGAATISSPTTLTKDMNYTDLTVNSTLTTDGYAIYVSGTLSGSGTINWGTATVGGAASGTTAGIAGAQSGNGRLKNVAGSAGGDGGGSGSAGTAGTSKTSAITSGVAGGDGGSPNSGAGGAGGTATKPSPRIGTAGSFSIGGVGISATGTLENISAGAGAGGGGGGGSSGAGTGNQGAGGGGGGASGGTILIVAKTWAGTFTIQSIGAVGGAGANATGAHTGDGGGGGGAGGCGGTSITIYKTKTWSGSYTLTGGAGGAAGTGTGTGTSGSSGTTGTTGTSYEVRVFTLM